MLQGRSVYREARVRKNAAFDIRPTKTTELFVIWKIIGPITLR
jgi:hypothetical protein